MNNERPFMLCFTIVAMLAAVACQPAPAPATAAPLAASPTVTSEPTATPTVPPQPSPTFPPEIVATKPTDIAGVWRIQYKGALAMIPGNLTLTEDSRFWFENADDGSRYSSGTLRFADGRVTFESETCYDFSKGVFPCKMPFVIYSSMQDGAPLSIRFEAADEQELDFITNFDGKTLLPVES
jgi:hypothetical protein